MSRKIRNITALIYDRKGRLISVGKNSYVKTHPLLARLVKSLGLDHRISLHAEIAALVRLKDWPKAHKIVITRFNKLGKPVIAKPCPICQRAIHDAGIKIVEHT
jgi:tRNA(Arg) A34 adenosine deaminase TadA